MGQASVLVSQWMTLKNGLEVIDEILSALDCKQTINPLLAN